MNRGTSPSPAALQIAGRLLAREGAPAADGGTDAAAAALQRTCWRVVENLRDSMGEDGRDALLARALARTEADHPALTTIRQLDGSVVHLDGVIASIEAHGLPAVTAAIGALLAALIDILGRLVGEDMAIRLIDEEAPRTRAPEGAQAP